MDSFQLSKKYLISEAIWVTMNWQVHAETTALTLAKVLIIYTISNYEFICLFTQPNQIGLP
jgi:hypothetical protein